MSHTITFYRHPLSGHCHRVELFMSMLGLEFETVNVDLANGEHKQPDFLALNLFGQVPVIDDNGTVIADSNAILVYFARRYDTSGLWNPDDAETAAQVQRFLSVAAGQLVSGPAAARLVNVFGAQLDHDAAKAGAAQLLTTLDRHLAERDFLAAPTPTIADLSCYAYVAHAPEGDVDLQPYANVRAWLQRIEALPGFVPMQATATGLAV